MLKFCSWALKNSVRLHTFKCTVNCSLTAQIQNKEIRVANYFEGAQDIILVQDDSGWHTRGQGGTRGRRGGWMTAAIFSEKSWKSRFGEFLDYWASTDQTVQKSLGFGFFNPPWHVHGVWKNAKTQSHLVKFGCGSPVILLYFFGRPRFFLKRFCKKYSKNLID